MKWLFIRFSSSLPGLVRGWEGQHHSQALKDCQLAHISCQGATQGENVSDLSACVPTELGFCYLTQWAQPKLSQIAQTLFVHGSEWYFTWEESVFHYIVTYVLLQSQLITAEISKCQFPQTKEKGKNVKLTTHLETYPKCDWFCVSSIYLTIFKKGTYVTENTDKTIFCFYWNVYPYPQISTKLYEHNSLQRTLLVLLQKNKDCTATVFAVVLFCALWVTAFSTMSGLHSVVVKSLATNKQFQFPEP